MSEKKEKRKYDKASLDECIKRDGATLIGEYDKLTRETLIKFQCRCGEVHNKKMNQLCEVSGAFCKKCTIKNRQIKSKETNKMKYGVENPSQAQSIKNKKKEKAIIKYGVDCVLQSTEIKEKITQEISRRRKRGERRGERGGSSGKRARRQRRESGDAREAAATGERQEGGGERREDRR